MEPAARTIGADSPLASDVRLPASAQEREAVHRHRFDASARAGAQPLLLRLLRALSALAAVLSVQAACHHLGFAWPHPRLWAVLMPVAVLMLPCAGLHRLTANRVNTILRLVAELPGNIAVPLALQALLWLGGLFTLPAAALLALVATQLLYVEVAHAAWLWLSRRWLRPVRLVVVGANAQGVATADRLRREDRHAEIVGFVDDRSARADTRALPAPYLGSTAVLARHAGAIDGVVIALPGSALQRVDALASTLRDRRIGAIYLAPEAPSMPRLASDPRHGLASMVLLGAPALPLAGRVSKRLFDITFAATALACFLPFGLLIALLIKLESPGPVIFKQRRYGRGHQLFDLYKFRSMRFDPRGGDGEIRLTQRSDARVTRLGAFLRRSSLDEFPQFINVLLGQMSVVGPRPHPPGVKVGERVYEDIVADFMERYKVRPGLTGWAQVNGLRGSTFTEDHLVQRFAHDIEYIRNWSFELDLWIVLKTVWGGFGGRNAF